MRLTKKSLPRYAFIPGLLPHPLKSREGHMYGEGDPVVEKVNENEWMNNENYLYSLDLLNMGYFWESHVWLEALWNAHKRKGYIANFFKALIKVGAAGVKIRQKSIKASSGHLVRAKELFEQSYREKDEILGFTKKEISEYIIATEDQLEDMLQDKHLQRRCFPLLIPKYFRP